MYSFVTNLLKTLYWKINGNTETPNSRHQRCVPAVRLDKSNSPHQSQLQMYRVKLLWQHYIKCTLHKSICIRWHHRARYVDAANVVWNVVAAASKHQRYTVHERESERSNLKASGCKSIFLQPYLTAPLRAAHSSQRVRHVTVSTGMIATPNRTILAQRNSQSHAPALFAGASGAAAYWLYAVCKYRRSNRNWWWHKYQEYQRCCTAIGW